MSTLTRVAAYRLSSKTNLWIARGSVVDFSYPNNNNNNNNNKAAIVNAANEACLGGGGVDGAITSAGGPNLARDRLALPIVVVHDNEYDEYDECVDGGVVRCPTGDAKMTGPGSYGSLQVSHVIHAVGPNYWEYDNPKVADALLSSAYRSSLERAHEAKLEAVAFALLSAGIFRGTRTVSEVLRTGVESICDWVAMKEETNKESTSTSLKEVVLCGFNEKEVATLVNIAEDMKLPEAAA